MKSTAKAQIKTKVLLFSLFGAMGILPACSNNGGSNNAPAQVNVPGVRIQNYPYNNNGIIQNCNVSAGIYSCTDSGRSTGDIRFTSLENFCSVIQNDQTNGQIAYQARRQAYDQQCNQVSTGLDLNNDGFNTGIDNTGLETQNFKTIECQLNVKRRNLEGDTGVVRIPIVKNGSGWVNLFANVESSKSLAFLKFTRYLSSNRLGQVIIRYLPAGSQFKSQSKLGSVSKKASMDLLSIEAKGVNGDIDAVVTGFAGSETRLTIGSEDESDRSTFLNVSCRSLTGSRPGPAQEPDSYKCVGEERDNGVKNRIATQDAYDDSLVNSDKKLTNALTVAFLDSLELRQGAVTFEQAPRRKHDGVISTSANLSTTSSLGISRKGYKLNVTCGPTR